MNKNTYCMVPNNRTDALVTELIKASGKEYATLTCRLIFFSLYPMSSFVLDALALLVIGSLTFFDGATAIDA